ncbi:TetR/AcrR family transcriptional regulator [Shewanella surugensis]|uniref:TetR/AcrR family transcriptional regulator n=1 Tax=Shewanella surugensis TaxID=212020 RepID=A0ABT0L9U7_9GAMM|nr:TetR/AcrR family transcriptional regulator [Shewanella surugensis]MCL1124463.1 TetR/AcrR family transcriptional regulator [Shewanella surugensis]
MTSTVEQILDSAESQIRIGGYNSFSVNDIATAINIKNSNIQQHFPEKADLAFAVVFRYRNQVNQALEQIERDYTNIEERLYHYASFFERAIILDNKICPCTMLGAEIDVLPSEIQTEVKQFFLDNISWLSKAIFSGKKDATLRSQQLIASLDGAALLSKLLGDPGIITQLIARFIKDSHR